MKKSWSVLLLLAVAPVVMACDLTGTKGQVSDDGQQIVQREMIPLREQALRYGGYRHAAQYIEQNRKDALQNPKFSAGVKHQIDVDLTTNVEQLNCWAALCDEKPGEPLCHM